MQRDSWDQSRIEKEAVSAVLIKIRILIIVCFYWGYGLLHQYVIGSYTEHVVNSHFLTARHVQEIKLA